MRAFNWRCPYCNRDTTIALERTVRESSTLTLENADGRRTLATMFIVCPNPECQKFTLIADLYKSRRADGGGIPGHEELEDKLQHWDLVPPSRSRRFPDYIPSAILSDYQEASLIRDLSPKASATLARRCLQGIIRDYWSVNAARLVDEIEAINDKVDPLTWDAIDAVRKIGNIGAHMEKDIDVIVDVAPNEAELLIGLVETLIQDWYINRENRKERLQAIVDVSSAKEALNKSNGPSPE